MTWYKQTNGMKKKFSAFKLFGLAALVFAMSFAVHAFAMAPNLSVTSENGNSVQMTVYGDPNSSVILYYQTQYETQDAGTVGYTDATGYFSSVLNAGSYAVTPGAQVYVLVDNQQSGWATWPYVSSTYPNNYGTISLSQTSVNLLAGQSSVITAYNESGSLYVSANSNPLVATAVAYSNEVTVTAETYGSTTLTVCSTEGSCNEVYVTVNGTSVTEPISLSSTSLQFWTGQSYQVDIYGNNSSSYYVSSNSNPTAVSASIVGNSLSLYGAGVGSSTISVCQSSYGGYSDYSGSGCATIFVTVSQKVQYTNPYSYNNNYYQYPSYPWWYWRHQYPNPYYY
jgi:hypothetical protein